MVILSIIQATEGADRRDNIVGHVALVNSPLNTVSSQPVEGHAGGSA